MARGFSKSRRGVVLALEPVEVAVLRTAIEDLAQLVGPAQQEDPDPLAALVGIDDEVEKPDDPALARLFPDAYTDDDEAAAEFRRYTDRRLRSLRSERAERCLESLRAAEQGRVTLSEEDEQAFLTVLNDLRLILGIRLEITEDDTDPETIVAQDDPRRPLADLYIWITWLQSALLHALAP